MSTRQKIELCPLTTAEFMPYGQVIAAGSGLSSSANGGNAERFDDVAKLAHGPEAVSPTLAVYRVQPTPLPLAIKLLECHPHSSQVFVSMTADYFLVITALATLQGQPDLATIKAFRGNRGQGVNYNPGVWHYPIVALHEQADFLMFMWETESENCVFHELTPAITIVA